MDIIDEAAGEPKETPKRKPKNFEEGFTMVENRIQTQGRFLSSDAKVAYTTLKSFQNEKTKLCYPSYDKIMERSGLSRPDLADALEELERFNWISKKKRFGGSTFYTFHPPFVFTRGENGERIPFADQTCPTKLDAKQWLEYLKRKRGKGRKSWSERVKAEATKIEKQEAEWENDGIPF